MTAGCACGCSEMTTLTNAEACGCGCACCGDGPKSRDDEIAELTTLQQAIERRLGELRAS